MNRMTRTLGALAVAVIALAGAMPVHAASVEAHVGAFFPQGDSNLFRDDGELYGTTDGDFTGVAAGIDVGFELSRHVELGLYVSGYDRDVQTSYRDFTYDSGREITQTLHFETVPFGATVRFLITNPDGPVVPYVGGGAGGVWWRYEEYGAFIDFEDPERTVLEDAFFAEGTNFAAHAVGGLRFRINQDFSLTAQARYDWADAEMGQDFRGNRIDLSGLTVTGGVRLRF